MQRASCLTIVLMMIPCSAVGQQKLNGPAKVLTVCEVLGDLKRYADTAVAVVGRMERSVSRVDHYEFLSQGRCEHPVITHGHVWANKFQVWTDWKGGGPMPPSDRPNLQGTVVAAKLSIVRKTTKLGSDEEPGFKADGHPIIVAVPKEWAVVYGRIVRSPRLEEDCGAGGCGGNDAPLIIVAEPGEVHLLRVDGNPLPKVE